MINELKGKVRAVLTGATGMVGEGVLLECLASDKVEKLLVIGRKSCGMVNEKLEEIIVPNLADLSSVKSQLSNYNACFFCAGVTSIGKKEDEYTKLTYDLTMSFAKALLEQNKDMVFCYVSGKSTDGTEQGKSMWARVKGKTENDLAKLPFRGVYNFRPGMIVPIKGQKNVLPLYKYLKWMVPILKLFGTRFVCSVKEIGLAMINAASKGYEQQTLEIKDIVALSTQ